MNNIPKIYFFTGASGAGKTKLLESLAEANLKSPAIFLHFDKIGVLSAESLDLQVFFHKQYSSDRLRYH